MIPDYPADYDKFQPFLRFWLNASLTYALPTDRLVSTLLEILAILYTLVAIDSASTTVSTLLEILGIHLLSRM